MKSISMTDVRLHLTDIMDELEPGEELFIEKRGVQIAKITLLKPKNFKEKKNLAGSFKEFLTGDLKKDEDFDRVLDEKELKLKRGLD